MCRSVAILNLVGLQRMNPFIHSCLRACLCVLLAVSPLWLPTNLPSAPIHMRVLRQQSVPTAQLVPTDTFLLHFFFLYMFCHLQAAWFCSEFNH